MKRQTVYGILTNEMYIGNMVQNTHNKISYNSKNLRKTNESEYIVVKDTHEAIIDKEKFDNVQNILQVETTTRVTDHQPYYLLGGMLYCHDCGRTIRISQDCSSHRINYDWLEEDIVEYLQEICEKFCKEYDFNEIEDNSENIVMKNIKEITKKIERIKK